MAASKQIQVERQSALHGHYEAGLFGLQADREQSAAIVLQEVLNLSLWQVAAWPDTYKSVATKISKAYGSKKPLGPNKSASNAGGSVLRVEPLKFWVIGDTPANKGKDAIAVDEAVWVDQSHSRTQLRITGEHAVTLLNQFLPLDLRESQFAVGDVASSALHHVGVTLWRSQEGYELFIPRGFALALWEVLIEGAAQYGYEVI